jgi:hypothetical protein
MGAFTLGLGVSGLATYASGAAIDRGHGRAHIGRIGGAMSALGLGARAAGPVTLAWALGWLPGYREALLALAAVGVAAVAAYLGAGAPRALRQDRRATT